MKESIETRRSKYSVYMIAIIHLSLFIGLFLLSIGARLRTIVITVSIVSGVFSVLVIFLVSPRTSNLLKRAADTLYSEKKREENTESTTEIPVKAPRWERRWAKTEARRLKKKERKSKKTLAFRRESTEFEQRERQKRAEEVLTRTREQAVVRSHKEQLKLDRKLAAQAAEAALRALEAERQYKIDQHQLELKQKRAAKRRAELEAEKRSIAARRLDSVNAAIYAALALSALAEDADTRLVAALEAIAEAPHKRRSYKSKALAKKFREKAYDAKGRAKAANSTADDAARHAHSLWLQSGQGVHTFPTLLQVRVKSIPTAKSLTTAPVYDSSELTTTSSDDAAFSDHSKIIIETPAEIRRLIEQVRTTHAKHLVATSSSAPTTQKQPQPHQQKTTCLLPTPPAFEDERDPHLRCQ